MFEKDEKRRKLMQLLAKMKALIVSRIKMVNKRRIFSRLTTMQTNSLVLNYPASVKKYLMKLLMLLAQPTI